MPVRTFRSSAFSAVAPQRVRFIPYTYIAPPIDGPGPVIYNQPVDADNPPDSIVVFSLDAAGEGVLTYQWQMMPPGDGEVFSNITDDSTFDGSDTRELIVSGVTGGIDIYTFRCVVTNVGGSTTSEEALLIGNF